MTWDNEQEKYEAIEAWLGAELDAEQHAAFEARMKADPALAEEVAIHQKLGLFSVDPELSAFEEGVREVLVRKREEASGKEGRASAGEQEALGGEIKPQGSQRRFPTRVWAIAAAVVVLILATGWIMNRYLNPRTDALELFAENYQSYPMVITIESGEELVRGDSIRLQESELAYRSGQYPAAYDGFKELVDSGEYGADLYFYFGMAALETNHLQEAETALEKVLAEPGSLFFEAANWYLGLCYLKAEEVEKAVGKFEEIVEGRGSYKDRASDILKKL